MARLAVTSKIFPLLEVTEQGRKWEVWKDFEPTPLRDYIKAQGRFRHLNDEEIAWVEREVERNVLAGPSGSRETLRQPPGT